MQTQANFKCCNNCRHKECQRQAHDGNEADCVNALQELTGSSIFLENVLDLSHTLAKIMIVCGIQECKARTAVDIITYAFLNYDLVCYRLDARPTKRLRKEDLFHELGRKCLMNRLEAHLCYSIIKRGFKAFYYFPQGEEAELAKAKKCNNNNNNNQKSCSEECLYVHAAKRTAESYGQFEGLSCVEQRGVEAKILVLYKKFYDRLQARKIKPGHENCNCCFCAKSRGYFVYAPPPPPSASVEATKLKKKHVCPCCCKKMKPQKILHARTGPQKCAICQLSSEFCSCPKYLFDFNWVGSIWSRPDMNLYYHKNIEKETAEIFAGCSSKRVLDGEGGEEKQGEAEEKLAHAQKKPPEADESQPVADENQPVADESQPVADESQPVADESQPVADESQPVADKSQPVADESQPATGGLKVDDLKANLEKAEEES